LMREMRKSPGFTPAGPAGTVALTLQSFPDIPTRRKHPFWSVRARIHMGSMLRSSAEGSCFAGVY
jgi:hypothetical protein